MARRRFPNSGLLCRVAGLLIVIPASFSALGCLAVEPSAQSVAGFNSYIGTVESRLAGQHRTQEGFLAPADFERLRREEPIVERLTPEAGARLPGALLHHWRATAFAPGATAADFDRLLRDFDAYPRLFAPQVLEAKTIAHHGDHVQAWMRIEQRHAITVTMDATYDVEFGDLDARDGYCNSRSTRLVAAGHDDPPLDGLLWRLNTYWSYAERDGGLYIQIESVSLTRSIPRGLGWAVGPFVESVPREELEFTLRAARDALKR
jgi:hypothetical protein